MFIRVLQLPIDVVASAFSAAVLVVVIFVCNNNFNVVSWSFLYQKNISFFFHKISDHVVNGCCWCLVILAVKKSQLGFFWKKRVTRKFLLLLLFWLDFLFFHFLVVDKFIDFLCVLFQLLVSDLPAHAGCLWMVLLANKATASMTGWLAWLFCVVPQCVWACKPGYFWGGIKKYMSRISFWFLRSFFLFLFLVKIWVRFHCVEWLWSSLTTKLKEKSAMKHLKNTQKKLLIAMRIFHKPRRKRRSRKKWKVNEMKLIFWWGEYSSLNLNPPPNFFRSFGKRWECCLPFWR